MKVVPTKFEVIEICRGCKGYGIDRNTGLYCETCEGTGRVKKTREIITRIEPYHGPMNT